MAKRALITGITGQDGAWLAKLLLSRNYEVFGLARRSGSGAFSAERLDWLGVTRDITILEGDLLDLSSLLRAMQDARPDEIYNLAAQSYVMTSWRQPLLTGSVTALGAANMLEAMRIACPSARFYQASSSEMFGQAATAMQNEATPFQPRSPYAAAKLYAHWMTVNYRESFGLHASCGILFNHESPLRGAEFVTRRISRAVAAIRCGAQEKLSLGCMEARRDWGHARDYVEAMWLMLQQPEPVDLVIATGTSMSVRDICRIAFAHAGLDMERHVTHDPALLRPAEVNALLGDASKAQALLGWKPRFSAADTMRDMVNADIARQQYPLRQAAE
ncbi:GDP-mannose 4,6-dehydratase [Camelimonas sp. ID_303_24]